MKQETLFHFLSYRVGLLVLFTAFITGTLTMAGQHEKIVLEGYLPLIDSQSIDTVKEIREAILSMDEGEELRLIRQALCSNVIRTACEAESNSEHEIIAKAHLDTLQILTRPGLYVGGFPPEVWDKVFSHLCPEERADVASVCRLFNGLSQPHGATENAGGLSNETWYHVLSYLLVEDLPNVNCACRALKDLVAYKREAMVQELCHRKDKEGILHLLNTNALSPKHLTRVWNTFIALINPTQLEWGGHFSKELNSFYDAFCKQLFRIMDNRYVLNNHFEWVIEVIKRIKTKDDQFKLLAKLAQTYEGDEGDLLFDAMDELFRSNEGIRAQFMPHLAKNSKLVCKNLKRIFDLSQNSASTSTSGIVIKEHVKVLAEHYSRNAQDLLDYAERKLEEAIKYNFLAGIGHLPFSIYVGLLNNKKLSRECYETIASKVPIFIRSWRGTDYAGPLLCALCSAYTGDTYKLLERTVLDSLRNLPSKPADVLRDIDQALKEKATEFGKQGDDEVKEQLEGLAAQVLKLANPGV